MESSSISGPWSAVYGPHGFIHFHHFSSKQRHLISAILGFHLLFISVLVCDPLLLLSRYFYASHPSVFCSFRLWGASGSSLSRTVLMYIWSHLCLVVSPCPFIFSLPLPLFSLISSALSVPLRPSSFFSLTVHCWSTFPSPLLSVSSSFFLPISFQSPILLSLSLTMVLYRTFQDYCKWMTNTWNCYCSFSPLIL